MKLKLLLLLFLLPFVVNAANTNQFDNVLIKGRLLVTNSLDSASRGLINSSGQTTVNWGVRGLFSGTSTVVIDWGGGTINDGTGVASIEFFNRKMADSGAAYSLFWNDRMLISSTGTTNLNWQTRALAGGAWTLNGGTIITNGASPTFGNITATTFNGGTVITNNASPTFGAITVTTINGKTPATLVTNITSSTLTVTGQGTSTINVEGAAGTGAAALTNAANFFTVGSLNTFNGFLTASNMYVIGTTTNATSVFTPTTAQLGTNAAFVTTISGTTFTTPNGLNINAGVQTFPPTTAGTTTNGTAIALYLGSLQTSAAGGIDTIAGTGTNFVWSANAGSGFGFIKARMTTSTNIMGSVALINTWFTNPTQQRAAVSFGVVLPTGVASQSQVQIWKASGGFTNIFAMTSPAGVNGTVTNNSPTILIDPGGSVIVTNRLTAAGAPSLDNTLSTTDYQ